MSNLPVSNVNLEADAQRLVGKFLQEFALLEQALDTGIGKLLGLDDGKNDIVCSSIPFAKKLGVFFSAEGVVAAMPSSSRARKLRNTRSQISELNSKRVIFAHNAFSASENGVSFRRVVADKKLVVSTINFSSDELNELCQKMEQLKSDIISLVSDMKPYVPALDFSDPRNSMYISLLFAFSFTCYVPSSILDSLR